ncbi:hypothetical protein C0J52_02883 [Blattella germanica]|nr:hypothetical protein C0J52_02883 [Blattella germanica]
MLSHDVIKEVTSEITMFLYADDTVMLSNNNETLQEGFDRLHTRSIRNWLEINTRKKKKKRVMKFQRGGNVSKTDVFVCSSDYLEVIL